MPPFVFPPAIAAAVAALGAAALARALVREWHRINADLERMDRAEAVDRTALPKLQRNPRTGVYQPE